LRFILITESKHLCRHQEERPQKITKLAIGVEGGFQFDSEDRFNYEHEPYCFTCQRSLMNDSSPALTQATAAVLSASTVSKQESQKAWQEELVDCEHIRNLKQDSNAPKLAQKCKC
jgi:ubiquitin carboxyl-terminal hydrolase 5/13